MGEQQYKEALDMLQTIIVQSEGKQLISAMIKKICCLLMLKHTRDAFETTSLVTALTEEEEFEDEKEVDEHFDAFNSLLQTAQNQNTSIALTLLGSLICLTRFYQQGIEKLKKLKALGKFMHDIKTKAIKCNLESRFERKMEEILNEMQLIKDVDVETKIEKIAWMMYFFGCFYLDVLRYDRAIEANKQAIFLMESVLGHEAKFYRVLAYCYQSLGDSFHEANQLAEAENEFMKAIDVYQHVRDWNDAQQKVKNVSYATNCWHLIKEKRMLNS